MSEIKNGRSVVDVRSPTRLFVICAILLTVLAVNSVRGESSKTELQSTAADERTFLHQEVELDASPQRIYEILLDSKEFSAFSGEPAQISPVAGGSISMFGGKIVGRNVELVPNQRIVQAWRERSWEPGVYSLVKFELKDQGSKTKIIFDHTGFGEGHFEHLNVGWKLRYWEPLEKFVTAK